MRWEANRSNNATRYFYSKSNAPETFRDYISILQSRISIVLNPDQQLELKRAIELTLRQIKFNIGSCFVFNLQQGNVKIQSLTR